MKLKKKKKIKNYRQYDGWEAVYNPFLISEDLLKFIYNKKIISFVKNFLPKNEVLILNAQIATNSLKIKNSKIKSKLKNAQFVHSDFHYQFKETTNVPELSVMIALDYFSIKNGATAYYKRSHLLGRKPQINKKFSQLKIKPDIVELSPGSVVFSYGSTWHSVGENINGERRWGIQQRYRPWYFKSMFNFENLRKYKIFKKIKSNKLLLTLFGFNSIVPNPNVKRVYTVTNR